jgi:hypothetical protein
MQTGSDGGCQGLLDGVGLFGSGRTSCIEYGTAFNAGDARRYANDNAGFEQKTLAGDFFKKVLQHLLGDGVIGVDAVFVGLLRDN